MNVHVYVYTCVSCLICMQTFNILLLGYAHWRSLFVMKTFGYLPSANLFHGQTIHNDVDDVTDKAATTNTKERTRQHHTCKHSTYRPLHESILSHTTLPLMMRSHTIPGPLIIPWPQTTSTHTNAYTRTASKRQDQCDSAYLLHVAIQCQRVCERVYVSVCVSECMCGRARGGCAHVK